MKQPSVYLKMRVLGALDTVDGRTRHERVHNVAAMTFLDEEGNSRQFTWRTIQTWHYRYKNHGITGMTNQPRKDKGQTRKVTPEELLEAINAAKPHFRNHHANKRALYRFCIEKGLLQPDRIAQTTFYRFIREYDLLAARRQRQQKTPRLQHEICQPTLAGRHHVRPLLSTPAWHGSRKQAKLIAFIDDASRVLCHGEFFFEENVDTLVQAIRAAFYKRGVPEQLLVDNGSIYCSQEITLICARVGCILRHTAVRDAAAKGKIERFFRRVRDQFLVRQLDLSSLEALNRQFTHWVENDYNAVPHDAIGMKPIDRFGIDLARLRFLPPSEHNDELFYRRGRQKGQKRQHLQLRRPTLRNPRRPPRQKDPAPLRPPPPRYHRRHHLSQGPTHGRRPAPRRRRQRAQTPKGAVMIRAFYGLTQNPFDLRDLELLPQQQEIHDTLKVHCQQGGLCLVLGVPGTGKSVIKQSLQRLPENQHLVATVGRTLHTYTNTVKILCDAFRIDFESSAFKCERRLIEQAFSLNHAGKSLTTILDDAHLMDLANLRKLRLLFEDFPKNHNLILIGQPSLLAALDLGVNQDIKSRVTYSVITKRLNADDMRDFILRELDRVGLGHNTFTRPAVDLIVRSADGVLRKARNLCVGCLIEAVRSANKTIDIDNVNRVLLQPHWQKESDLVDY